jgi:hypothetical protein
MNYPTQYLDPEALDTIRQRAKCQLLQEIEGKAAQEPGLLPLISFVSLLMVEFAAVGCFVFERDQNIPKALGFATVPVILTVAATAYQAEQYGTRKERERLRQDYQSILSETNFSTYL